MQNSDPTETAKSTEDPPGAGQSGRDETVAAMKPAMNAANRLPHDLNNTFATILMAIDMLRAKSTTAELLELANLLETSAKRGVETSRQLLAAARSGTL